MSNYNLVGTWSDSQLDQFLQSTTVPMRIAANTLSGFPTVTPLWFIWQDQCLLAASRPNAGIVKILRRDGRCAFDISVERAPYKGIRGKGLASIVSDGLPTLKALHDRYLGNESPTFRNWLLERSQDECLIHINPVEITSWDFSRRMAK